MWCRAPFWHHALKILHIYSFSGFGRAPQIRAPWAPFFIFGLIASPDEQKENPVKASAFKGFVAERVGFEPTCPCGQLDFESSSLQPLRYRSKGKHDSLLLVISLRYPIPGRLSIPFGTAGLSAVRPETAAVAAVPPYRKPAPAVDKTADAPNFSPFFQLSPPFHT